MNTTNQPVDVAPRANQTAGTAIPGHTLTPRMADLLCRGCDCPKNRCNDYGCSRKCWRKGTQ
jgi:hypothetical protein